MLGFWIFALGLGIFWMAYVTDLKHGTPDGDKPTAWDWVVHWGFLASFALVGAGVAMFIHLMLWKTLPAWGSH
jgi:hypothetical protein